jgi:nucleotide-binding universal stress UspA family protein
LSPASRRSSELTWGELMKRFQSILCPIDFSPFSEVALRYAAAFANQYDGRLLALHCILELSGTLGFPDIVAPIGVPENLTTAVSGKLDELLVNCVPAKVRRSQMVKVGNAGEIIAATARAEAVDLIVMGTHGRSGFEQLLLGSVTHKVLHKSAAPVLIVGKTTRHFIQADVQNPMKIDRILCALDLETGTDEIVALALDLARTFQSRLYVLHALGSHESTPKTLAMQKLQSVVDADKEDWCTVQHLVQIGNPAEQILNAVEENSVNLVVMGHHAHGVAEMMLGSNTMKVATLSSCPVFVLRV